MAKELKFGKLQILLQFVEEPTVRIFNALSVISILQFPGFYRDGKYGTPGQGLPMIRMAFDLILSVDIYSWPENVKGSIRPP